MEPAPLSREARATSWRVFVLVLLSASYFYQSSAHNEAARFDQIRAVAERGEWWIDRFAWNTLDIVRVGGHTYPNKAPGTTFLGVLPWTLTLAALHSAPILEDHQLILATYALTILLSALPTALISLMMLRLLARHAVSLEQSTLLSVGYGLGTIAFPWATTFFGHQLAAAFAFAPFYLIWGCRWMLPSRRLPRLYLAAVMLGFLPVIEHQGAIASVLIGLYALATLGIQALRPLVLGGLLGALPLALYNEIAFGNPETVSYSFMAVKGSGTPGHQVGIMGATWPRMRGLLGITFEAKRGLFYANPWLMATLMAPFFFKRIRGLGAEFMLCAAVLAGMLIFSGGFGGDFGYWMGGLSFGPRYILMAVPFAVLLVAFPMKSRVLGPLIGLGIVVTILLMLPATAIDPRLPYEAHEPFLDFYLPLYARGLASTYPWATFKETPIFDSPGAFNLGRVAGLPRDFEILPLTFLWGLAALQLFKTDDETRGRRVARVLVAFSALAVGAWPAFARVAPKKAGMCRATSPNEVWPRFPSYAMGVAPGAAPTFRQVSSLLIGPASELDAAAQSASKVAVAFSGQFEPGQAGWYRIEFTARGRAALFIDGLRRFAMKSEEALDRKSARVYLSAGPHELIVRYSSDQPVRELYVTAGLDGGPQSLLQHGLWTRSCP